MTKFQKMTHLIAALFVSTLLVTNICSLTFLNNVKKIPQLNWLFFMLIEYIGRLIAHQCQYSPKCQSPLLLKRCHLKLAKMSEPWIINPDLCNQTRLIITAHNMIHWVQQASLQKQVHIFSNRWLTHISIPWRMLPSAAQQSEVQRSQQSSQTSPKVSAETKCKPSNSPTRKWSLDGLITTREIKNTHRSVSLLFDWTWSEALWKSWVCF